MRHLLPQWLIWLLVITPYNVLYSAEPPPLPLAHKYQNSIDIEQYWVSEKLDGVRAYWDGNELISKNGNPFPAPQWFTDALPTHKLDGELWISRGQFEKLLSTVRQRPTHHKLWRKVRYMVFDLPLAGIPFEQRLIKLKQIIDAHPSPHLQMVKQYQLPSHAALMKRVEQVVTAGGEGLMLHKGSAHYRAGRSNNLLKVKIYQDEEATVIGHQPGKGKYHGLLGSLLVINRHGKTFKLGSGLSDQQRKKPPPIGSTVTYTFTGTTINGIPKFASFLRVRSEPEQ
ncbi:MAG: DNA ligase [Gammaproteobacteria bacterium]|nr:DNA ligase [Gammaproteobacteria bacterium]MCF6229196.1 DNA ligase [Gammaproteobacteria bacterium]